MKKLLTFLTLTIFALTSCSVDGEMGPPGPRGPQGPPGEPGEDGLIAAVFETTQTFTATSDYTAIVPIPDAIEVFESDVILVYLLEYVDAETNADVWSALPRTYYLDGGELVYNFNHTSADVAIFLDGSIDRGTLGEAYTDNQIFRIVIIPAASYDASSVNYSNYGEVEASYQLQEREVPEIQE